MSTNLAITIPADQIRNAGEPVFPELRKRLEFYYRTHQFDQGAAPMKQIDERTFDKNTTTYDEYRRRKNEQQLADAENHHDPAVAVALALRAMEDEVRRLSNKQVRIKLGGDTPLGFNPGECH